MPSRMTPEQHAKAQANAANANAIHALAQAANGHGVNRADQQKARAALIQATGSEKKADKQQENALQRAGAAPKGVRRFFS